MGSPAAPRRPEHFGIRSAAFATRDDKPYVIRVIALRLQELATLLLKTTESTNPDLRQFRALRLRTEGLLSGEAAHGSVTPQVGSPQLSRNGDASRLTANGVLAGLTRSAPTPAAVPASIGPGLGAMFLQS